MGDGEGEDEEEEEAPEDGWEDDIIELVLVDELPCVLRDGQRGISRWQGTREHTKEVGDERVLGSSPRGIGVWFQPSFPSR
jgi:hypothetical protein